MSEHNLPGIPVVFVERESASLLTAKVQAHQLLERRYPADLKEYQAIYSDGLGPLMCSLMILKETLTGNWQN